MIVIRIIRIMHNSFIIMGWMECHVMWWFMTCWKCDFIENDDDWWTDEFQEFNNTSKITQDNHTGKPTLACKFLSSAYAVRVAWLPELIILKKVFFSFYHRKTCIFLIMTIEKTRDLNDLPSIHSILAKQEDKAKQGPGAYNQQPWRNEETTR